jgi:hypothetical protein
LKRLVCVKTVFLGKSERGAAWRNVLAVFGVLFACLLGCPGCLVLLVARVAWLPEKTR